MIILKNASRMNRLTEDLLALASVESGDYKLRLHKIQASTLVEEAVASLTGWCGIQTWLWKWARPPMNQSWPTSTRLARCSETW